MLGARLPPLRTLCATFAALAVGCALLALCLTGLPLARAADSGQLQQQISAGRDRIQSLAGAVGAASARLGQLQAKLGPLQVRLGSIQAHLDAERAQLILVRAQLSSAAQRLTQLEAAEAHGEVVLSQQLVRTYETDRPDIVSVVLEAKGFPDLLERVAFASRIRKQDTQVVREVRSARRAVAAQATRLGALEIRRQAVTDEILQQRDNLAGIELNLVQQQHTAAHSRSAAAGQLASARERVASLQQQLAQISLPPPPSPQAQSASSSPGSSSAASGGSSPTPASSGGGFTFPMPTGAASPPGTWSPDDGVDISAPGNTPLLAIAGGTIVLHGIGGFGPSAPVLHLDSGPYVYYGHAGPGNMLPIGTHVSAGQAISEVGAGIVGISTGPHLEIGFCDSSGTPLGPQSAPRMLALLQAAY